MKIVCAFPLKFASVISWPLSCFDRAIFKGHYWVIDQAEFATDVLFIGKSALAGLFLRLLEFAVLTFSPKKVVRHRGRRWHEKFAQRQHLQALRCLRKSEFHFVLGNDTALIAPIINYLDEIIKMLKLCGVNQRMRVGVALQEACLNAIHHGNLEVSSDLRQEDESNYHRLVRARRSQAPYEKRRVTIDVNATADEVVYTITDEGPGFDPSTLPVPADAANLERIGGRGILLIRTFMDTVRHNAAGRQRHHDGETPRSSLRRQHELVPSC